MCNETILSIINLLGPQDNIIFSHTGNYAWYLYSGKKIISEMSFDINVCHLGNKYFCNHTIETENIYSIPLVTNNTKFYDIPRDKLCFEQMSYVTGDRRDIDFDYKFVDRLEYDTFLNFNKN